MGKIDHLEKERVKMWGRIVELEKQLEILSKDPDKASLQSLKKASEYKNRATAGIEEANRAIETIQNLIKNIEGFKNAAQSSQAQVANIKSDTITAHSSFQKRIDEIAGKIDQFEKAFEIYPDIFTDVQSLLKASETGKENLIKIEAALKQVILKKQEIDKIYLEIYGYTEETEDEEEVEIAGLKDQLEESYQGLSEKADKLQELYDGFVEKTAGEYETTIGSWKEQYKKQLKEIQDLLPNALTAGLSHAYSEKKLAELTVLEGHSTTFSKSIKWLVAISLIPFAVSVVFLFQGKDLSDIILQTPQIVTAILPLYVPVLWLAYSANKKANLSKRLIEEYTHKEVLSKTYEGLSKQVRDIENESIAETLKQKLLINILNISGENPGKLISDYNKADHPLMDALDKSLQLANAVEKLERIPGLSKVAKMVDKKSRDSTREVEEKIDKSLDKLEENQEVDK